MKRIFLALLAITLATMLAIPAFAPAAMDLPHRGTWDADIINSDTAGYTGEGVYIAVLDTGLVPNWRDYFPKDRIATHLGKGFWEPVHVDPQTGELVYAGFVKETSWVGSTLSSHGTHVTSTIIGYNYYAPADALGGLPLPPLYIGGIAPDATVIPVKVLTTYNLPPYTGMEGLVFGTDLAVAAGIYYATELKLKGYSPMVISMSIGGPEPSTILEDAIDYAIENGVIVVAAAGNEGLAGMVWPGAYPQVISAGANGWRYEWYWPTTPPPRYRLWWLQDSTYGYRDIPEPTPAEDVYVTDWSSRENDTMVPGFDQELDVLAPGSWVRGPFPGFPAYNHLPWWAPGWGWYMAPPNLVNFYYVGGTSMSTPHVSAVAALMLEKNHTLSQGTVESILKSTALDIPPGSMTIYDYDHWATVEWELETPTPYEATGAGLIQADAAVAAVPP
jgi:subtilisin family serine protease